ncbi:MAG: hypothetical protein MUF10_11225 [Thermoanaerobaculaceae bacterium]|nr:hypothetical protein [Thermoanaerobaculaceae bacterium]
MATNDTMPIPEPGTKHLRDLVMKTSSDWEARRQRAEFLRDSVLGSGGYQDYLGGYDSASGLPLSDLPVKTYLARHPRETAKRWDRRRRTTYYPRYLEWMTNVVVGLMTRETPQRDNYPTKAAEWISSAKLDEAWKRILPWSLQYDWTGVVVDMPRLAAEASLAAQLGPGQPPPLPFLKVIHNDQVLDWGWDNSGLAWVKYAEDYVDHPDPLKPAQPGQRVWVLTRAGWWRYDLLEGLKEEREAAVAESAVWPDAVRGRVPMAIYHLGDDHSSPAQFPGAWLEAPARIMRRLYNLLSATAATEDNSCFPLMRYQCHSPDDLSTMAAGDSTVIPFPIEAGSPPDFMSYDTGPLEVLNAKASTLIRQLKELVSLAFDETSNDTGIAKSYSFLQLNVTASKLIGSAERLERQVVDLALRFMGDRAGLPAEAIPGWPRKFDQVDAMADIEAGWKVLDMQPGPLARGAILKRIVLGRYLQDLSAKDKKAIEREIDEESTGAGADGRLDDGMDDQEDDQEDDEPPPEPPALPARRPEAPLPKNAPRGLAAQAR